MEANYCFDYTLPSEFLSESGYTSSSCSANDSQEEVRPTNEAVVVGSFDAQKVIPEEEEGENSYPRGGSSPMKEGHQVMDCASSHAPPPSDTVVRAGCEGPVDFRELNSMLSNSRREFEFMTEAVGTGDKQRSLRVVIAGYGKERLFSLDFNESGLSEFRLFTGPREWNINASVARSMLGLATQLLGVDFSGAGQLLQHIDFGGANNALGLAHNSSQTDQGFLSPSEKNLPFVTPIPYPTHSSGILSRSDSIPQPKRGRGRPRKSRIVNPAPSPNSARIYETRGRKFNPQEISEKDREVITDIGARLSSEGYESRARKAWEVGKAPGLQFDGPDSKAVEGLEAELRQIRPE